MTGASKKMASHNPNISDILYSELNYSQEWINCHVSEHVGYHYRQYLIKFVEQHKNIVSVFESYYNFVIKQLNLINDGEYINILVYLLGKQNKPRLLEETYSCINFISLLLYDLFIFIDKLNKLFPEHESLFYHRRFLVYHLLKLAYEYHSIEFHIRSKVIESSINTINNKNIVNSDVIVTVKSSNNDSESNQWPKLYKVPLYKIETCNLYKIVSNSEKHFVSENLNNSCTIVQIEFTKRYQKWMKYVIGFE
ncbi:hypothetical protein NQ314_001226 [Rhamnusium bicolor]|uniref:Maturase K n=1 Tax=Rhamnusium bicolor TaxID=1586634 RepID=A0AAV8ZSH4_9CUCU|nr:hypothetical protein NQ314_001226 [Rhamnusium bicolor]